jgi:hypothetical protein
VTFGFQSPARPHPVQISVDIELKQIARRVAWAPYRPGLDVFKTGRLQIKAVNKGVDEANGIVRSDVIIDRIRQERQLRPIRTGDVSHARSYNCTRFDGIPLAACLQPPTCHSIAKINFLFFTPPNDFDAQADKLAKALGTDLSWLKDHTRLGEDAARWNENGRPSAMLLRGQDIAQAERWMLSRPREAPPPTELQTRYIMESRRSASRRRLTGLGAAAVVLLVVAILGTLYLVAQREAGRQQTIATARRLTSAAELLRDQPRVKG